jgi:hypothetical protein
LRKIITCNINICIQAHIIRAALRFSGHGVWHFVGDIHYHGISLRRRWFRGIMNIPCHGRQKRSFIQFVSDLRIFFFFLFLRCASSIAPDDKKLSRKEAR